MKKKENSKLLTALGLILLVAFIGFYVVTAVLDLIGSFKIKDLGSDFNKSDFKKGDYVSAEAHYGSSLILTMKHSVNFIPTGKEYYYLILNDSTDTAIYVRANKKFGDQFTDGINYDGVKLSGKVRYMKSKVRNELSSQISELKSAGMGVPIITSDVLYIDAVTKTQAILRLVGILFFVFGVVGIIVISGKKVATPAGEVASATPKIAGALTLLLMIAGLVIMIHTLCFL